ncbi:2-polyprenyl-6-methoxyphenol hydroxylase-like FAD-dependent oxidoreductase [Bradyrhizobium diazoefficiens]
MRYTDIAIIGGGLSGSTTAAMLGRAGISTVLIDPHESYPADFRVEKLSGHEQVERFLKTGIAESVLRRATFAGENWIARFGRLLDKAPSRQFNILYDSLVNAVRDEIPATVERICAKAVAVETSLERQKITLANDETISARLVVLANGLNVGLRHQLGIARKVVSACHSISIGFDVMPAGRNSFDFPALTYFSERPSDRTPYISLFPVGTRMRANLFVYRSFDDPWLRELRRAPAETLDATLPRLKRITGAFDIPGELKVRPVDLYVNDPRSQPGIVLVGDAFATSCPVAGTGCDKVFTDVERLCNVYIPQWLSSDGMNAAKIAGFYRRSGQASLRSMVGGEGVRLPLSLDRDEPLLDGAALGALHRLVGSRAAAAAWRSVPSGAELPRSLLLVVLVLIILEVVFILVIVAVVVGLSHSAMRLVDLVVPQLAIGTVPGEQFGMRPALDRPAP